MKKSMWLYDFVTWILGGIIKLLFRVEVTGQENEKFDGSAIYCINHMSLWDPVIAACVTKRTINFMAKKELFDIPVLKTILRQLGVFPIDRSGNDLMALRATISAIKDGASICLFPQGTRCPDVEPRTTEIKGGAAMLARHTKATIVPIAIYTEGYRIKLFKKVYVSIGTPRSYEEIGFTGAREDFERVTEQIFEDICTMCDKAKEKDNARKK